jgi:hypothetical protein
MNTWLVFGAGVAAALAFNTYSNRNAVELSRKPLIVNEMIRVATFNGDNEGMPYNLKNCQDFADIVNESLKAKGLEVMPWWTCR